MLRRVAFTKAVTAGALGAAAWEVTVRPLVVLGLPVFDLVHLLGTLFTGDAALWWWPVGMLLHGAVGAVWAIFYGYFFWSAFNWRPAVQGLVFSLIPAVLAGLVMVPQLGWMHPTAVRSPESHPGIFAVHLGLGGPLVVVFGHVLYGVTMGSLYTRPVGSRAGLAETKRGSYYTVAKTAPLLPPQTSPAGARPSRFMFATGIEGSYPTIENGRWRVDQMEETGHYRFWRRDLELVRELGLRHLRYGPPLHHVWRGPDSYDWSFTDAVVHGMRELGIVPIMDLCHFGLPTWLGNFQNPDFPELFAAYAAAFARRYDDVTLFTPVNEMFVTAKMSALDGVWNEQLKSERAFVTAAKHLAKANLLAAQSILRERPQAVFVNSESGEFYQACCPDEEVVRVADFENERRFIALDLLYGVPPRDHVRRYLLDNWLGEADYAWFMRTGPGVSLRSILGIDYYEWNEKLIKSDRKPEALGELFGWYVITKQYFDRYRRPLMHTETNSQDAKAAPTWLWRQWHNVQLMRHSGVPVLGFTWYSLVDQVDWNIGLSRPLGNVNPVGLYDLNRDPRPVAESYRRLVAMFGDEGLGSSCGASSLEALLAGEGAAAPGHTRTRHDAGDPVAGGKQGLAR